MKTQLIFAEDVFFLLKQNDSFCGFLKQIQEKHDPQIFDSQPKLLHYGAMAAIFFRPWRFFRFWMWEAALPVNNLCITRLYITYMYIIYNVYIYNIIYIYTSGLQ